MHYIYALCSSDDYSNIRYIGQTNNPYKRLKSHFKKGDLVANTRHNNWIKKNISNGNTICMKIIESNIPENNINDAEIFYIKYYRKLGYDLTNSTDFNANTIHQCPAETRLKISKTLTGRKLSEDHRLKIVEALKRRVRKPLSEECRIRMSVRSKGIPKPRTIKATCPHCGLTGDRNNMKRWHFDNCKHKQKDQINIEFE